MFKNLKFKNENIRWLAIKIINIPFHIYSFLILSNSFMLIVTGAWKNDISIFRYNNDIPGGIDPDFAQRFVDLSPIDIPKDLYFLVPFSFFLFHYLLYMLHPKSAPWILTWWKEPITEIPEDSINFFIFLLEWRCLFSPEKFIQYITFISYYYLYYYY